VERTVRDPRIHLVNEVFVHAKAEGLGLTERDGNEPQVSINVLGGGQGHQAYCGTLTMSEIEWATFIEALRNRLGDAVEVEDLGVAEAV
jgi:hypothetical protein